MVKKFTTKCDFGGQRSSVNFYVGNPAIGTHPLNFQARWLASNRGGKVPGEIMDSFEKIATIAIENRVPFEDLCGYVIEELNSTSSLKKDFKQASALSAPAKTATTPEDKKS